MACQLVQALHSYQMGKAGQCNSRAGGRGDGTSHNLRRCPETLQSLKSLCLLLCKPRLRSFLRSRSIASLRLRRHRCPLVHLFSQSILTVAPSHLSCYLSTRPLSFPLPLAVLPVREKGAVPDLLPLRNRDTPPRCHCALVAVRRSASAFSSVKSSKMIPRTAKSVMVSLTETHPPVKGSEEYHFRIHRCPHQKCFTST